jgi:hypothetical protein
VGSGDTKPKEGKLTKDIGIESGHPLAQGSLPPLVIANGREKLKGNAMSIVVKR